MIVTAAQLKMLRKGAVQVIEIPATQWAPGAPAPKPPVEVGRAYGAQLAPFTPSKLRVVVHGLELDNLTWRATVTAGDVEKPRFLAARPGKRGDYVTDERYAMQDEPECIPEADQKRYAEQAEKVSEMRRAAGRERDTQARTSLELYERLRILESSRQTADITSELRAIRQRLDRAERRAA